MKDALLLVAWKLSAGLATPQMLAEVAEECLLAGSDSLSLAILAGEDLFSGKVYFEELKEYFIKGLADEGISLPNKKDAEIALFLYTLKGIRDGSIDPVEGMHFIDNYLDHLIIFPEAEKYVGAKLGLEHCYTWYREHMDCLDGSRLNYCVDLPRPEAAIEFKERLRDTVGRALIKIEDALDV